MLAAAKPEIHILKYKNIHIQTDNISDDVVDSVAPDQKVSFLD